MLLKSTLYIISIGALIWTACNSGNQQQDTSADTTSMGAGITTVESDTATLVTTHDSIGLTLSNGTAEQKGMMEKGKHIVFSFDVSKPGKLKATVKPDAANGNVRIAQIFMPDNTADGPFGMEMTYDLEQTGKYRLIISENQMAGDPYNGPFTLNVKVE